MPAHFVAKDVIYHLDSCVIGEPYCFFMDLGHGYLYTANSRLTLYADEGRWAIVFEKSGYANRGGRIELELNFFGNCLHNLDRAGADDRGLDARRGRTRSPYSACVRGQALKVSILV